METLTVIIPVFNEADIVEVEISRWVQTLRGLGINFNIAAYDDGSRDGTLAQLNRLAQSFPELNVYTHPNCGHGPTILRGYQNARSDWIFQADADNEISPAHFVTLWQNRQNHDFLIGARCNRQQRLPRYLVSLASHMAVKVLYGSGLRDVNCPFRLMRRNKFADVFHSMPANTCAPNVILSGMAIQHHLSIFQVDVPHHPRHVCNSRPGTTKFISLAGRALMQSTLHATQATWTACWKRRPHV